MEERRLNARPAPSWFRRLKVKRDANEKGKGCSVCVVVVLSFRFFSVSSFRFEWKYAS